MSKNTTVSSQSKPWYWFFKTIIARRTYKLIHQKVHWIRQRDFVGDQNNKAQSRKWWWCDFLDLFI